MGGVDDQHVDARVAQRLGARERLRADAHRRAAAQSAEIVLRGGRIALGLLNVLDRDEPRESAVRLDDEQLLDAVFVEQLLRLLHVGSGLHRHQPLAGRHHVRDRLVRVLDEAQIPVGEDPDRLPVARDGYAGDLVAGHHLERLVDPLFRPHGDGIHDHARLGSLDLVDLGRLGVDLEAPVDDPDPAVLGHADRGRVFGDRIHGRRHERDVERDAARQLAA